MLRNNQNTAVERIKSRLSHNFVKVYFNQWLPAQERVYCCLHRPSPEGSWRTPEEIGRPHTWKKISGKAIHKHRLFFHDNLKEVMIAYQISG